MAARQLSIRNLSIVPFRDDVVGIITPAFEPLTSAGDLEIDLTGTKFDAPTYELEFDNKTACSPVTHKGCQFLPSDYGVSGMVHIESIQRKNFCVDVTRCDTCETLFRNSKDELGKQIGQVAVHEIGHLFGLNAPADFKGADADGHIGDPGNFMFAITRHKDFQPPETDSQRTKKYKIVKGDWLSKIALRVGFWPVHEGWKTLYNFKGKDGKANKELLRSGDPNLIFPGEEIWIPDIPARIAFTRAAELQTKSFTAEQIATMRAFVKAGKTIQ
jgi:hypothetical protein